MTRTLRIVPLLLIASLGLCACGGEKTTAPTTNEADTPQEPTRPEPPAPPPLSPYEKKLASLPAPSAENSWSYEGSLLAGGNAIGSVKMSATAGDGTWTLDVTMNALKGAMSYEESATYDANLTPVKGTLKEKGGDAQKHMTWTFADGTLRITDHLAVDTEPKELTHPKPFMGSVAPLFHFCHLIGHEAGTFEVDICEIDEAKFVGGSFTTGETGTWNGAAVRIVKATREDDKAIEAGYDAASGAFLGAKFSESGTVNFEFRKGVPEAAKPEPKADGKGYFDVPAKTAQQAAAQAALSFALADFDLIERVTHWPTVAAVHTEAHPDKPMDADSYKALLMAGFRTSLKPQGERAMIAPFLEQMAPNFKLAESEGSTLVEFGPMFKDLTLHVKEIDGVWYLVKFPDPPKAK